MPLLAGINATDPAGIEREIEAAIAAGYRTLKIKAGFDLDADLQRIAFIQRCNGGRAKLRIDANQGYSRDDGVRFAARAVAGVRSSCSSSRAPPPIGTRPPRWRR